MNPFFLVSTYQKLDAAKYSSSSSRFLIRAATLKDLTGLTEILAESFHSRHGIMGWVYPILRLGIYEDLRNRLRSQFGHYVCLVAITFASAETDLGANAEPIAAGTVEMAVRSQNPWQLANFQYLYLSNLAVHPHYRRQGIAKALLNSCEQIAQQWGFSEVYLHVLENNLMARQLYDQAGYRLQEVECNWGAWLLGQPRRLLMRKYLAATTSGSQSRR